MEKSILIEVVGTLASSVGAYGVELAVIKLIMKKFNVTHDNVGEVWKTWNNITRCKYIASGSVGIALTIGVLYGGRMITEYLTRKQELKELKEMNEK